jgi:hypothetical protein
VTNTPANPFDVGPVQKALSSVGLNLSGGELEDVK